MRLPLWSWTNTLSSLGMKVVSVAEGEREMNRVRVSSWQHRLMALLGMLQGKS